VSQRLLDVGGVSTASQEQGCVGVPEIMPPYVGQLRSLEQGSRSEYCGRLQAYLLPGSSLKSIMAIISSVFTAIVYQVLIASPSDVMQERQAIPDVIHSWNSLHALEESTVLLPVKWETHSAPEMGDRPQAILNKRVLDDADLLIGVFWTRIGSHTGVAESGTVEEVEEFIRAGKTVMLYFSRQPIEPSLIDPDQYQRLQQFREKCRRKGLVEEYSSIQELRQKLERQLTIKLRHLRPSSIVGIPVESSKPSADQITSFFKGEVFTELSQAKELSETVKKPIFMVIYDAKHSTNSRLTYSLGNFMDYETTQNLVVENFVQVLVDSQSEGVAQYIPADDPLENCLLVILTPEGDILRREGVYANPDEGLKRVRATLQQWENTRIQGS
jgi:hypothetical protein